MELHVDRVGRWLRAEPRDVVRFVGVSTAAPADEAGGGDIAAELRRCQAPVARRRLLVLLRRHAVVAALLALPLEALALAGAFPRWVAAAVPIAALILSVTALQVRRPAAPGIARSLDDDLGLHDQVATALGIELAGGPRTALEARTVRDAAGRMRAAPHDWRARSVPGPREWWVLAASLAALAALVAIGAVAAGSSSSGPEAGQPAGELAAGGAAAGHEGGRRQGRAGRRHQRPGRGENAATPARGGGAAERRGAAGGYRKIPQGRGNGKARPGGGRAGGAGQGGKGEAGQGRAGANAPGGNEKGTAGTARRGGRGGPGGGGRKGGGQGTRRQGAAGGGAGKSQLAGAGGRPGAPRNHGGQGEGGGGRRGGAPTGSRQAGGGPGTNRRGAAKPIPTRASRSLRIQPGYAPARGAGEAGARRRSGSSPGGGGKARTGRVGGGRQVGDEFTYVPTEGGAVVGPDVGLRLNYLKSLKWVRNLPW